MAYETINNRNLQWKQNQIVTNTLQQKKKKKSYQKGSKTELTTIISMWDSSIFVWVTFWKDNLSLVCLMLDIPNVWRTLQTL